MRADARKLCQSLRINIDDLRAGMFVSELDRPWTQTSFMLQGFLLTELLDLQSLQALVKEVLIDPSRSDPQSLLHLPWELLHEAAPAEAEVSNASQVRLVMMPAPQVQASWLARLQAWFEPAKYQRRSIFAAKKPWQGAAGPKADYLQYDSRPATNTGLAPKSRKPDRLSRFPPPSTTEFSQAIQTLYPRDVAFARLNLLEHWNNWCEQRAKDKTRVRGKNIRPRPPWKRTPDYLSSTVSLVVYQDQSTIQDEIVFARTVIEKADKLLSKLSDEIRNDRSIELEEVRPTLQLLTESVIANPAALMWLLRMRSKNCGTYAHGLKVAVYMMTLGRQIGFLRHQLTELGFIGLLLDIGKLELPETLWSTPDKYTEQQQALMQTHVHEGIKILESGQPLTKNILRGIREHHERMDGSGYPQGLFGMEISLFGRIAAIADSFAAMTSERPYGITRSSFDAMKELFKLADTQLHAPLVEEFVQAIGIFPVGSIIELSSGEVAVVLEHNQVRRLEPKLLILTGADKSLLEKPKLLDLMRQKNSAGKERVKIQRGLPDGAYGLVYRDFYRS